MVRLLIRQIDVPLACTDPLVGPKIWKGTGDLVRIILKWILRKCKEWGTDWIKLAQNRNTCRPVVNTVMNLSVP